MSPGRVHDDGEGTSLQSNGATPSKGASSVAHLPLHPIDKRAAQPVDQKAGRKLCVRCKKEQSAIAIQTASYCTACFEVYFDGKVRANMEQAGTCAYIHRTEIVKADVDPSATRTGRVAVALSGGASSRVMLRLVQERLLPPVGYNPAKGRPHEIFAVDVIYVDDSAVLQGAHDRTEEVRALVEQEGGEARGLYFVPLRLEDAFENGKAVKCRSGFKETRALVGGEVDADASESLHALFDTLRPRKLPRTALGNARSRAEDLHRLLIAHLVRREATRRGCSCLLTGESATRRAIRTIEGLGRGQGHKMAMEEGPARWHDLFCLRPMADATAKEIAFYVRAKKLDALAQTDLVASELLAEHDAGNGSGGSENKASIGRLTESLIQLLESNVPGTINTVNRTNSKLVFHDDEASHLSLDEDDDSMPFQHVGPSLSLRQRRLRLQSEQQHNANGDGTAELDESVRALRLGGQGTKNYVAAQSWPHFEGNHACPLCQMPAQRGLQAWRRGLTVDKATIAPNQRQSVGTEADDRSQNGSIDLSDLLCYACNLLLDTPETTAQGAMMPLPSFVLHGARQRLREE